MIKISLTLGKEDRLLRMDASGHANCGRIGTDPVCAAVSFLLRTVALYLSDACTIEAKKRGLFSLEVLDGFNEQNSDDKNINLLKLKFISEFVILGINSLVQEYPENVKLKIYRNIKN